MKRMTDKEVWTELATMVETMGVLPEFYSDPGNACFGICDMLYTLYDFGMISLTQKRRLGRQLRQKFYHLTDASGYYWKKHAVEPRIEAMRELAASLP